MHTLVLVVLGSMASLLAAWQLNFGKYVHKLRPGWAHIICFSMFMAIYVHCPLC
jgi:hypothetical protein